MSDKIYQTSGFGMLRTDFIINKLHMASFSITTSFIAKHITMHICIWNKTYVTVIQRKPGM